jgi:hypothetical protein
MNFRTLWHHITSTRYSRSLEQRIVTLEENLKSLKSEVELLKPIVAENPIRPAGENVVAEVPTVQPKPFQIRRSWRMKKIELELQHNKLEEKGKRLAKNLQELPPRLYE